MEVLKVPHPADCGTAKDYLEVYDLGNGDCLTRGAIGGVVRPESACDYLPFGRSKCLDINANIVIGFRKARKGQEYVQPNMQVRLPGCTSDVMLFHVRLGE
jgi:hypothetical protein